MNELTDALCAGRPCELVHRLSGDTEERLEVGLVQNAVGGFSRVVAKEVRNKVVGGSGHNQSWERTVEEPRVLQRSRQARISIHSQKTFNVGEGTYVLDGILNGGVTMLNDNVLVVVRSGRGRLQSVQRLATLDLDAPDISIVEVGIA